MFVVSLSVIFQTAVVYELGLSKTVILSSRKENKCDETKNDIKDRNGSAESVIYTVPEVQFVVFFFGETFQLSFSLIGRCVSCAHNLWIKRDTERKYS